MLFGSPSDFPNTISLTQKIAFSNTILGAPARHAGWRGAETRTRRPMLVQAGRRRGTGGAIGHLRVWCKGASLKRGPSGHIWGRTPGVPVPSSITFRGASGLTSLQQGAPVRLNARTCVSAGLEGSRWPKGGNLSREREVRMGCLARRTGSSSCALVLTLLYQKKKLHGSWVGLASCPTAI